MTEEVIRTGLNSVEPPLLKCAAGGSRPMTDARVQVTMHLIGRECLVHCHRTGAAFCMNNQARFDLATADDAPLIKEIAPYEAA